MRNKTNKEKREPEIWKPVAEFPEYLEVSSHGRIKSTQRFVDYGGDRIGLKNEKILTPQIDKDGYKRLPFIINRKRYRRRVNILVGLAFVDNPNHYPLVGHLNNVKDDNYYKNLIWCTNAQNIKYAYECGLMHQPTKEIFKCSLDGKKIKKYKSVAQTKEDGFRPKNVSQVLTGSKKTHLGYKFIYA